MSEQGIEFVELKLRVPKNADDWFRKNYEDVQGYYRREFLAVLSTC